ncbi:hypothetical protein [Nocardia jinanensis]|uniref:DUF732 domain-containing protein n=1 Tax=Nocardia jinanensis TaxID=382504 RepID=A0A917RGV3_9NOCA|nr:hypothetical protein [Nocardia jinanensis]GGL05911.1 hypothetical protein GCM10011588_20530 [Nocardia jinanensis]
MNRPLALLSAVFVAVLPGVAACQSDTTEPGSSAPATTAATSPDTAQMDQVKAGSFVIGFRGAFPGLAVGRDDAAITAIFTETCADIRAGDPEDEVVTELTDRLAVGDTEPTGPETQAVYQMIAVMCRNQ